MIEEGVGIVRGINEVEKEEEMKEGQSMKKEKEEE